MAAATQAIYEKKDKYNYVKSYHKFFPQSKRIVRKNGRQILTHFSHDTYQKIRIIFNNIPKMKQEEEWGGGCITYTIIYILNVDGRNKAH